MNRKIIFLVCLCAIVAGQVSASNAKQRPVSKRMSFVSKARKSFGKISNERGMQLRADEADAANISLRSTLEPGHNKPDSAISYYGGEEQYPGTKSMFAYNGDVITETIYSDYYDGEWHNMYNKEEYAFDAMGNRTLHIYWSYSNNELSWAEKSEYAYNPNGTPLYEKLYEWEDDQWRIYFEMIYQYDAAGMLTGGTFYNADMGETTIPLTVSGTPENLELSIIVGGITYAKTILHYDPATMKLLSQEYFETNEGTGVMEWYGTDEYTYDAAGRLLTEIEWEEGYVNKQEYVYNVAGQKLTVIGSNADSKEGTYTVYDKTEYVYENNRLTQMKYYSDYADGLGLVLRETTVFYYAGGSGNEQVRLAEVSVYPNPVTDVLTVSGAPAGATLTIADLSGRTVGRQTLTDRHTVVSVTSLPAGIYLVIVRSDKGTETFKIVKK
jgi:hypothetical protein